MSLISRLPLIALFLTRPANARSFVIPEGMSALERKRFEPSQSYQIKGVCGESDIKQFRV